MLQGKNILLGITGSIAAYKAAFLTRLLVKEGASVRIIMTEASTHFITPLTLSALSGNPVITDFTESSQNSSGTWNNHVELGLWADILLIAPATANTLADLAGGHASSYLAAVYLSARCPVFIAPAMDLDMFKHGSTKENLEKLISRGAKIIQPGYGDLASGLVGEGRLAEPEEILRFLINYFGENSPLAGKKILITAGPTYEPIDPVRFIGNHSSGKMGFALAEKSAKMGAEVVLVSGPVALQTPKGHINRIDVKTASEMYGRVMEQAGKANIIIMAAAVADYTPVYTSTEKIKKKTDELTIQLKPTKDILSELGKLKSTNQLLVGFALETENEQTNAVEKLKRKNLDWIVLNSLKDFGAGFATDTNKIFIFGRNNKKIEFELKSKQEVALDILQTILNNEINL
ncbi:MAG: bifunctional phosphopantothenoylcysteine decarboxylase/phosphopantothenate--cysteine ligase CoaBC [Flavobacteriales bacterium]